jgi:hypothetical protein
MKNMCLINLFNIVNLYGHFMLKPLASGAVRGQPLITEAVTSKEAS